MRFRRHPRRIQALIGPDGEHPQRGHSKKAERKGQESDGGQHPTHIQVHDLRASDVASVFIRTGSPTVDMISALVKSKKNAFFCSCRQALWLPFASISPKRPKALASCPPLPLRWIVFDPSIQKAKTRTLAFKTISKSPRSGFFFAKSAFMGIYRAISPISPMIDKRYRNEFR